MIECHFLACNWYPDRFDQQPLFGWHHWCELWCYLWSRCEADWIQARPDGFQRFWPLYQLGLLGIGELRSQPSQVQWLSQTPEMDWNGHLLVPMCSTFPWPTTVVIPGPRWSWSVLDLPGERINSCCCALTEQFGSSCWGFQLHYILAPFPNYCPMESIGELRDTKVILSGPGFLR